ncbi:hypothetical protein D3C85_1299290 [compost metagenome]
MRLMVPARSAMASSVVPLKPVSANSLTAASSMLFFIPSGLFLRFCLTTAPPSGASPLFFMIGTSVPG